MASLGLGTASAEDRAPAWPFDDQGPPVIRHSEHKPSDPAGRTRVDYSARPSRRRPRRRASAAEGPSADPRQNRRATCSTADQPPCRLHNGRRLSRRGYRQLPSSLARSPVKRGALVPPHERLQPISSSRRPLPVPGLPWVILNLDSNVPCADWSLWISETDAKTMASSRGGSRCARSGSTRSDWGTSGSDRPIGPFGPRRHGLPDCPTARTR